MDLYTNTRREFDWRVYRRMQISNKFAINVLRCNFVQYTRTIVLMYRGSRVSGPKNMEETEKWTKVGMYKYAAYSLVELFEHKCNL